MSPMAELLNQAIENNPDEPTQLVFEPGGASAAGVLGHGPVEGIYTIKMPAQMTPDAPAEMRDAAGQVLIVQYFQATAVQRIIHQVGSAQPSSGIVLPGQH